MDGVEATDDFHYPDSDDNDEDFNDDNDETPHETHHETHPISSRYILILFIS